jgi:predicted MPP superfamily phosphohydrolase
VVQEAHDVLADLRPDLLLLSGDIVETPSALALAADLFAGVRATLGACAVLGNWEYARGTTRAVAEPVYGRAGVELLVNRRTLLQRGGAHVEVAGFDDLLLGEPDLRLGEADADAALRIWVMHEPGLAAVVRTGAQRPQLMLAGHTHGGQIRLPLVPPYLPEGSSRMAAGWYRPQGLPLYVSRGVGTTNVRARFRCPAELPVFTFRRA